MVTISSEVYKTLRNFVSGHEPLAIRLILHLFVDENKLHDNAVVTIVITSPMVVQGALQILRIQRTSVSQPCDAENSRYIITVGIKGHSQIALYLTHPRRSQKVVSEKCYLSIF